MKKTLVSMIFVVVGCGSSVLPGGFHGMTPVSSPENPSGSPTGFAQVLETVLQPRCVRCHEEFADYETTKAAMQSIRDEVATGRMPKRGPPLTSEEKEILFAWIDAGGPK